MYKQSSIQHGATASEGTTREQAAQSPTLDDLAIYSMVYASIKAAKSLSVRSLKHSVDRDVPEVRRQVQEFYSRLQQFPIGLRLAVEKSLADQLLQLLQAHEEALEQIAE